jgi:hypothetical protein
MKNANTLTPGKFLISCILLFLLGCGGGSGDHKQLPKQCKPQQHTVPNVAYNIYIENSGSMAGYLGNASDFKKVLIDFISDIPAQLKKDPRLFFVNDHVCSPQMKKIPLVNYIMQLTPGTLRSVCSSSGTSLLPQVIDSCTSDMKGKVNILVSDCIFSDKNGSTTALAEAQMKVFMSKKLEKEGNISTIVLKFNSSFSGLYYNEFKGGKGIKVNNINRPYYLLIFGHKENLAAMLQNIDFKSYPGYEASYCLSAVDSKDDVYAAMSYKNKKGDYSIAMPSCLMRLTDANGNKGELQFSFDADLSRLGYLDGYLLDTKSYVVNDGFSVVNIKKEDTLYNLTLKTVRLSSRHALTLHLKYDIPAWVSNTGNENDSNPTDSIQQHQTFGFKQLMSGISQAYKASNPEHAFKIPIPTIQINK